jgi:leucyl aminopeptidase
MHIDMAGSAAVLAVMQALPQLGYAGNVVGVLALAENAVGPDSYKPLAVLPSAAGSVEVCDTDAEGRLVLADAITYVQRAHSPARLVDLATLTGASVVALGEGRAALFANDASGAADGSAGPAAATGTLAASLTAAGERVGERLWRMPIDAEHRDELKSAYADLRNCAPGRLGGACVAAAFLEKFVGPTVDWAHIDLAGPAMLSKAREWAPEGGTGFGAQLLLDWLTQQQRAESERDALEKFKDALGKVKQADMGQQ